MDEPADAVRGGPAAVSLGTGFLAAGHLILCRELMTLAGGDETVVAATVGASLAWAALGAAIALRLCGRLGRFWPAWLLSLLPVLLGVELWAVRGPAAGMLDLTGGQPVPWSLGVLAALLCFPVALTCGLFLVLAARGSASGARFWSAAGAGLAAGGAALVLAGVLGFDFIRTASALCGAFACLVSAALGPVLLRRGKLAMAAWTVAVAAGAVALGTTDLGEKLKLRGASRDGRLGGGGPAVAEIDAPTGNLAVFATEDRGVTVYLNGAARARQPDPLARDDAVFACGQAPNLGLVLVVGGGRSDLVRELLRRGALRVDVVGREEALEELIGRHLPEADPEMLDPERVRREYGNLAALLGQTRTSYDLVVFTPQGPATAAAARLYSREFLEILAGRVTARGTLVICLPAGAETGTEYVARLYATLRELSTVRVAGGSKLVGLPGVFPADGRIRVAAVRSGSIVLDAHLAAARYRRHKRADGTAPLPVAVDDLARLINRTETEKVSAEMLSRWESAGSLRETALTPRTRLDYVLGRMRPAAPGSAAVLAALMYGRATVLVPFVALFVLMVAGWFPARRVRGKVPGKFTLLVYTLTTGLTGSAALALSCTLYAGQNGALYGALPLLVAAVSAGVALGASLAGRLAGTAGRSPRRALGVLSFGSLLVLAVASQAVRLPAGTAWADLAHGVGLLVLGVLAGMELSVITSALSGEAGVHSAGGIVILLAGAGALIGGALTVGLLLESLGPLTAVLLLLAAKMVAAALLAAGAGRRRSRGGSGTSLPRPVSSPALEAARKASGGESG
ncbi:MAG: polyamine aminopropyltransferase [Planctomycetota bacterium]|jgi:hypothetical protein